MAGRLCHEDAELVLSTYGLPATWCRDSRTRRAVDAAWPALDDRAHGAAALAR